MPAIKFLPVPSMALESPWPSSEIFAIISSREYVVDYCSGFTSPDPLIYDHEMVYNFMEQTATFWTSFWPFSWADTIPDKTKSLILQGLHIGDDSGDSVYLSYIGDQRDIDSPIDIRNREYQELTRYFLCVHAVRNVPFRLELEFSGGDKYLKHFSIFPEEFFPKASPLLSHFYQWLENTVVYHETGERV